MDTLYAGQTPATQAPDDGTARHLGLQFTVTADGAATAGRYWVPSTGLPTTARWQLWRVSDQTRLADIDLTTQGTLSPSTWLQFPVTPISLVTTETYRVVSYTLGGQFVYTDPGAFPLGAGAAVASTGVFRNNGTPADYPATTYPAYFFADFGFTPAGVTYQLSAALGAISTLGAAATRITPSAAVLSAAGGLAAAAVRVVPASATLTAQSGLTAGSAGPVGPPIVAGRLPAQLVTSTSNHRITRGGGG